MAFFSSRSGGWRGAGACRLSPAGELALAGAALTGIALPTAPLWAAPSASEVRISAGPLADAVHQIALATRTTILFSPAIMAGRNTPAMRLDGEARAMLRRLLAHSGLHVRATGAHTLLIEAPPPAPHRRMRAAPGAPLPPNPADIVVTAMRRPTLLADTPVSMIAITGADLSRAHVTGLRELANMAPSLTITNSGSGLNRLSLRGVYAAGEPTVGFYFGNVPLTGPGGTTADPSLMVPNLSLVDIDRVEVLRGPQGTLYGTNSLAGTVRILFRMPDPAKAAAAVDASGALTRGGGASGALSGMVNLPLVRDRLALRAVAWRDVTGGVIDNQNLGIDNVDRQTRTGGRLALRWQIAGGWRLDLGGVYQRARIDDNGNGIAGLARDRSDAAARSPFSDRLGIVSADLHGTLGAIALDGTLAHSIWKPRRRLDFSATQYAHRTDGTACAAFYALGDAPCSQTQQNGFAAFIDARSPAVLDQPFSVTRDSAELRLSGSGRLTWTAGGFASSRRERGASIVRPVSAETGQIDWTRPPTADRRFDGRLDEYALFADGGWQIRPWLGLSAGARHFWYQRQASGAIRIVNPITGPFAPSSFDKRYTADGTVGRIRIELHPNAATLLYGQIASGFRPGGINVVPDLPAALAVYRDDRITSDELGGRFKLHRDRLRLDVTAYRQTWSNMQYAAASTDGSYVYVTNIGSARIDGGELSLNWEPVRERFRARLEAAYTDARLTSGQTSDLATTTGRKGDRLPYVAPLTLNLALMFDRPLTDRLALFASLYAHYAGRAYSTFRDSPDAARQPMGNTGMIDINSGLRRGGTEMMLFVDNLTDRRGILSASVNLNNSLVMRNRPRTIGLSLHRAF